MIITSSAGNVSAVVAIVGGAVVLGGAGGGWPVVVGDERRRLASGPRLGELTIDNGGESWYNSTCVRSLFANNIQARKIHAGQTDYLKGQAEAVDRVSDESVSCLLLPSALTPHKAVCAYSAQGTACLGIGWPTQGKEKGEQTVLSSQQ